MGPLATGDLAGLECGLAHSPRVQAPGKTRNPPALCRRPSLRTGALRPENDERMVSIRREPPCERGSRSRRPGAAVERRGRNPAAANFRRGDRRSLHLCAGQRGRAILEEGYALRAVDIDIIYLNGYGFSTLSRRPHVARRHGGIAKRLPTRCEFHQLHGEAWAPAPLLKRLAEAGKTFAEFDKEQGTTGLLERTNSA